MKTTLLSLLIVGLSSIGSIFGQASATLSNKSGLYLTANDFTNGKLTYEINCKTEKHKIKNSDFLNTKTIKVQHHDTTTKLLKSEIWGFRLCNGKNYRIFLDKEYEIVENIAITIYLIKEKSPARPKSKTSVIKTRYYFSEDAGSPLKELTLKNVETSFVNDKKFHDLVDLNFKTDSDLLIYDDYYGMFRLNHEYIESLK